MMTRTALAAAALVAAFAFAPARAQENDPKDEAIVKEKKIQLDAKNGKVEIKEIKELIKDAVGGEKVKPKAEPPKKVEAKVSPEAKAELDALTAAYQKLAAVDVSGTFTADYSVGGQVVDKKETFTGSFAAPNKFRHEMKGDVVLGSTGESLYAHLLELNKYKKAEAPKERIAWDKLPDPMREVLREQNPALLCAVVDDAGKALADMAKDVTKAADASVNGQPLTALDFKGGWEMDFRVLIDPKTKLIRQVVQDRKRQVVKQGRSDVERAVVTIDYPKVATDAKPDDKAFAWAAPDGAKDLAAEPATQEREASALVGKPAPDFTLPGMDGRPVTLSAFKGQVVVLDFWATWCGPCKVSLPGLNKMQKELADKGMKAFAVDLGESKEKVQPVAAKLIPDVTVLLDEESQTGPKYGVQGIPQTVVIGKDGTVRKVIVGAGQEAAIRAAVDKALGE